MRVLWGPGDRPPTSEAPTLQSAGSAAGRGGNRTLCLPQEFHKVPPSPREGVPDPVLHEA